MFLAIGLSQVVQLPIAVASSLNNPFIGILDIRLSAIVIVGVAIGTLCGALASNTIPTSLLKRGVGIALLLSGLVLVLHSARACV